MAQSSKSRIMIWLFVGVLVVVAVVMLVSKPKDMGKPIDPDQLARSYTRSFERLDKRVAKAQFEFPGAPAEQWQKINEEIALGRQVLAGVPGVTDQKDLAAKRESLQHAYVAGNKILKAITGTQDQDEPKGGE